MGRVEGKVAFITGAAHEAGSQPRSAPRRGGCRHHRRRHPAQSTLSTPTYELATPQDLERTVAAVEALGRRIVARQADVRDLTALTAVLDEAVGALGRLDIVVANAGIEHERAHDRGPA